MKPFWLPLAISVLPSAPALAQETYPLVTSEISCPGDQAVWVNTTTGVYHYQGERWFGRTKHGQFECEKQAEAEGDRATRSGQ
jgi:hypothetical protein